MEVTISDEAPLRVHALHYAGPMWGIAGVWKELWRINDEMRLDANITEALGVSAAAPKDGLIDYYAGLALAKDAPPVEGLEIITLPGGLYANYRLVGPYAELPGAYGKLLGEWLPSSEFTADARPIYERYRNDPTKTPAGELITDLYIPVTVKW